MTANSELYRIADSLRQAQELPCVLATLVEVRGSSYRRTGARRLIFSGPKTLGSISGGCLETDLDTRARQLLESSKIRDTVIYDTTSENDLVWGVGTGCHGVVKIFLEKLFRIPSWAKEVVAAAQNRRPIRLTTHFGPDTGEVGTRIGNKSEKSSSSEYSEVVYPCPQLIIFGAGDDAKPLSSLTHQLGWTTRLCDPRPEFARPERFPEADSVTCLPAERAAAAFPWDDWTAAVVMTHHYRFDLPLLQTLIPLNLPYLGLLGPRERGVRLIEDAGFDQTGNKVRSPVGLDLGGDGPEAVGLAIVAEIQAVFHQRSGRPLHQRNAPIHDDE